MDWINEKVEQMREKVRNLPLKQSLILYLLFGVFIAVLCSWITSQICERWAEVIAAPHGISKELLSDGDMNKLKILMAVSKYCPYVYVTITVLSMGIRFYHQRLRTPTKILQTGTIAIQNNNLDFQMKYESQDEMGQLCGSFEKMRLELIANKEEMWNLIEEQKKINAAFAHDLRTPLTVLKGYSDFLYRYIPQGKVSEEKLVGTLKLMSEYIERLESYSHTMKSIRRFDEIEVNQEEISLFRMTEQMQETADALNQIGDIEISVHCKQEKPVMLLLDKNLVLEVVDNLLSNAIRYADKKVDIFLEADESTQMFYLYVGDDGPGFSKEELEKAASPYFSSKKSEKDEHFGIGLHIVSVLCQKCGGTISLANRMEGGAFVSVSFSLKKT